MDTEKRIYDPDMYKLTKYYDYYTKLNGEIEGESVKQKPFSINWYYKDCALNPYNKTDRGYKNMFITDLSKYYESGKYPLRMIFERKLIKYIDDSIYKVRDEYIDFISDNQNKHLYLNNELNDAQIKSIANALALPISIIQGPPGTGKTETILSLLAVAMHVHSNSDYKIAVVSNNNTAVNNIIDKLEEIKTSKNIYGDWMVNISDKYARLGGKTLRGDYFKINPYPDATEKINPSSTYFAFEKNIPFEFTNQKPIILSSIHSIRKLFKDSDQQDYVYDLVIMDEASQCDVPLGLIAYGVAKSIAIVGDTKQLPPIVNHENISKYLDNFGTNSEHLKITEGEGNNKEANSILKATLDTFNQDSTKRFYNEFKTLLNYHYRCHPDIIGFCNEYVYNKQLNLSPVQEAFKDRKFPINLYYYEGNYNEYRMYKVATKTIKDEQTNKIIPLAFDRKVSSVNNKQIHILKYELLDKVIDQLEGDVKSEGKNICVMSPYWVETDAIYNLLKDEFSIRNIKDKYEVTIQKDIDDFSEYEFDENSIDSIEEKDGAFISIKSKKNIKSQTVSSTQGQTIDIVYFLPVIDGKRHGSFSQNMKLINVAISRAREEVNILCSNRMFSNVLNTFFDKQNKSQYELFKMGNYNENIESLISQIESSDEELELTTTQLINYVVKNNGFSSFQRSRLYSIMDKNPKEVEAIKKKKIEEIEKEIEEKELDKEKYAAHSIIERELITILKKHPELIIKDEIYHDYINATTEGTETRITSLKYNDPKFPVLKTDLKRYDIGLLDNYGNIRMLIEVDGGYHRLNYEQPEFDHLLKNKHNNVESNDIKKNEKIIDNGGIVLENNSIEVWTKKINTNQNPTCILLRLPTDGSCAFETESLKMKVRSFDSENKFIDQYVSIDSILDYITSR